MSHFVEMEPLDHEALARALAPKSEFDISIDENGRVGFLVPSDVNLGELGFDINVRRASHVEFSNETHLWHVTLADGEELMNEDGLPGFSTRDEALAAEVKYLNGRIVDGTIEELWRKKP